MKEVDRDKDTTGLLTFQNEGSALMMERQEVEVNYKIKINERMVDRIWTLKFIVNRINDRLVYNCLPLQGKFENFEYEVVKE